MMSCLLRIFKRSGVLRRGTCALAVFLVTLFPLVEARAQLADEPVPEVEDATELNPEQRASFEKWIPHTIKRLKKRLPVHIVTLGDSVTRYMSYDENRENSHLAYHGVFAARLADEFFYTGAVRDIRPKKREWSKLDRAIGPEITLENLGMNGRVSLHALARITSDGLVNHPDLVLINFGINDALLDMGIATYVEALERSVKYVKSTDADVILLGPSHTARNGTAAELALTRPYSGAMEELAARLGVFYFDLGGVTTTAGPVGDGQSAEQVLEAVVEYYNMNYFDHGADNIDGLHPNRSAHSKMGAALFEALRDGKPEDPYRVKGFVTLGAGGKAVLEFKLENLQESAGRGHVIMLPVAGMLPEVSEQPFDLAAGKGVVIRVNYMAKGGVFDFPSDRPRVFAPLLIADTDRSYSPVMNAAVTPVGLVWDAGVDDLSGSSFEVKCGLTSTSATALSGTYKAKWNGQKSKGAFNLQAGGSDTIALGFEVPAADGSFSVRDDLVLAITVAGQTFKFVRRVESSRNIGLGEPIPMINPDAYVRDKKHGDGRVNFVANATAKELVLNFDVDNIPLEGDDQMSPLIVEFQLDARGYGKRRKFGYVDAVRVKYRIDGTAERIKALRQSVFGDWYSRALDNVELTSSHCVLNNGRTRYSIKIPRSCLYLHEFALGNANSMIGINADLSFEKANQPNNPYPAERHFSLVRSGLNKHAAESLAVLELVPKSSGRWSVRVD